MVADGSVPGRRHLPMLISIVAAIAVCALVVTFVVGQVAAGSGDHAGPNGTDYVDITSVPPSAPSPAVIAGGSAGAFVEHCGRDADGAHRNSDNMISDPGLPGGAHHLHDYVGNLSTNANSTGPSLLAAGTTCANGDRSTFYWPVLRLLGRPDQNPDWNVDSNDAEILSPATADIRFVGNPVSQVVPAPQFIRETVGDPHAVTDGGLFADARWSCTGYPGRITQLYPRCPAGSSVLRIFDFPSCWNGIGLDSPNHHAHVVQEAANGVCPHGTFPIPQLRITLTYDVPAGANYAIDTFPEENHSPRTDHGDFVDVMTDQEQARVVACVNDDRTC